MTGEVRIGVIGVGQIGKWHLTSYRKIQEELRDKVGGVKVVAVADINEQEARRVADIYQVQDVYTDFRKLLERDDIEAVDVCLHNNLHMPVAVAAMRAGKHVYCEKPMAGTYRDALDMYEAAQQTGKKLSIQLSTLFSKETRAARQLIEQGSLGKIYHARSVGFRRRGRPFVDGYGSAQFVQKHISSGGAMYDMGVYHIANMLYLMDNPKPQRISGEIYQEMEMDEARKQFSGYNVEELGLGFVRFGAGLSMDIIEAWAIQLDHMEGSVIVGSKGGIRLEPFGYFQSKGDLDLNTTVDLDSFHGRLHDLRENSYAYDGPQAHWIAALRGKVELLPTAELALNTMLISEGIYLSSQLGREVSAEEVVTHSHSTAIKL